MSTAAYTDTVLTLFSSDLSTIFSLATQAAFQIECAMILKHKLSSHIYITDVKPQLRTQFVDQIRVESPQLLCCAYRVDTDTY